jgi:hypothetical protein
MNEDLQYLKLLSIFHYIVGGLAVLFSFIPIIYVVIGILAVSIPGTFEAEGDAMPLFFGWIFIIIGAVLLVLGWAFSACLMIAGRSLGRQVHYIFCMVIAGIECMFMPFGTVLGVFTIVVLARPSVKEMFEQNTVSKQTSAPTSGSARTSLL